MESIRVRFDSQMAITTTLKERIEVSYEFWAALKIILVVGWIAAMIILTIKYLRS